MEDAHPLTTSHLGLANYIAGLAGGLAGSVLGYFAFTWLLSQGFYALALPGALLGFGCGRCAAGRSQLLGIVCAVAALALGIYAEWRMFPFVADESFGFFLRNLNELKPVTWIMICLGAAFGYWFGQGRDHHVPSGGPPVRRRSPDLDETADRGSPNVGNR